MQTSIANRFSCKQEEVLVERMSQLASDNIELRFYETFIPASQVEMYFDTPVIALMVKGEKRVKINNKSPFQYYRGESLIIPSGSKLSIDFPSATKESPTQCLAFVPDTKVVEQAIYDFKHMADANISETYNSFSDFSDNLLYRDASMARNVEYLIHLLEEQNEHRELFVNRASRELIVRILQSSAKRCFLHHFKDSTKIGFSYLAEHIKDNISQSFRIDELARIVCMSKSTFFSQFKLTFGITPNQFILNTKMEVAMERLRTELSMSITEVGFSVGYTDGSYFTKQFKSVFGVTPKYVRNETLSGKKL